MDCRTDRPLQFRISDSINPANPKDKPQKTMDKFKEIFLKLSENSPPTIKNLIEDHLSNFLSDFRTPDHPTYAAMIHRTIEELNENEGCTEESISKYIRRQYTNLPLAHNTLLRHHLGKLCDSGEILMTAKQFYMLPGANPNLGSETRPKKEQIRSKRKQGSRKGWVRWHKKDETERGGKKEQYVLVEYKCDMVGEQKFIELPNEVTEVQVESEAYEHQIVVAGDVEYGATGGSIGQSRDSGTGVEQSQLELQETVISAERGQQQQLETIICLEQSQPQQNQEGTVIWVPLDQSNVSAEHLEKHDQSQLSSLEKPPGFESAKYKELVESKEQQTKDLIGEGQLELLPKSAKVIGGEVLTENDLSETLMQIKKEQRRFRQRKSDVRHPADFPRLAPSVSRIEHHPEHQRQQLEMSCSDGLQQALSTDINLVEPKQQQTKRCGQRKWVKYQTEQRNTQDVPLDSKQINKQQSNLPNAENSFGLKLEAVKTFPVEVQQQSGISGEQEAAESQIAARKIDVSDSPNDLKLLDQEELADHLAPGSLIELQQGTARHQQEAKKCGQRKRKKPLTRRGRTKHVPNDSKKIIQEQQSDFPIQYKCSKVKLAIVESRSEENQQQLDICEEQPKTDLRTGAIITSFDLTLDQKGFDPEDEPDDIVPQCPVELPQVTTKQSSQTETGLRHVRRRSQRLVEAKQTSTVSSDFLPLSQLQDNHLGQPALQNCELREELKQLGKLRSWQRRKTSQPNAETYSLDSRLNLDKLQLQVEKSAQPIESVDKLDNLPKQNKTQSNILKNSFDLPLASGKLEPQGLSQIMVQRSKLHSWQKWCTSQSNTGTNSLGSSLSLVGVELPEPPKELQEPPKLLCLDRYQLPKAIQESSEQQQPAMEKPPCRILQPTPPKPEPETAQGTIRLLPWHQHDGEQQPEHGVCGRHRKLNPNRVVVVGLQSVQQKPTHRGRQRHFKLSTTKNLEPTDLKKQQPKFLRSN